jgi:type IV pilus assembly protein PilB
MKLGEMLVTKGLISPMQLEKALAHQKKYGGRIGEVLLALGFIDETTLASFLATQTKTELVDLDNLLIPQKLINQIPIDIIVKYEIIPIGIEEDNVLKIATYDPTDYETLNIVSSRIAKKLVVCVATRTAIRKIINELSLKAKYNPQEDLKEVVKIESAGPIKSPSSEILLKSLILLLLRKNIIKKEEIEKEVENLTTYEKLF